MEYAMAEVARSAWEIAPHGVTDKFMGHRLLKDKKIVVLTGYGNSGRQVQIFAFPKPEHSGDFFKALGGINQSGPGHFMWGSIGSLRMFKIPSRNVFELAHVQAHFKAGEGEYQLPRRLATFYGGWRKRVISEAIQQIKKQKAKLVVSHPTATRGEAFGEISKRTIEEIIQTAKEAGATIKEGDNKTTMEISFE
ncbi:MAG: hypothetical protein Q8R15_04555 [Candidatus Micrarchaeota archaeon]|nr:hypothetical protein [Candidatus Micrarchaeota archaeon]